MNLIRRKSPAAMTNPARMFNEWDPFRRLSELMRWDALRDTPALFAGFEAGEFLPDFEVKETQESYQFTGDLPGVRDKDLQVTMESNMLTISGKREEEKRTDEDKYHSYERRYGAFSRSFVLPDNADTEHVRADLKDGVLTIVLPKRASAQARQVKVSTAKSPRE